MTPEDIACLVNPLSVAARVRIQRAMCGALRTWKNAVIGGHAVNRGQLAAAVLAAQEMALIVEYFQPRRP